MGFMWSILGVFLRSTLHCTIENATTVLDEVANTLANFLSLFWTAVSDFWSGNNGDLSTAPIHLISAIEQLGALAATGTLILGCLCSWIEWLINPIFQLPQDPDLAITGDAVVNIAIKLVQSVFLAVANFQPPQIAGATVWLQTAFLSGFDFIEDAVLVVWNILLQAIDLIPTSVSSDLTKSGYSTAAASTSVAETLLRSQQAIRAQTNLSTLLGLGVITDVLAAPWSRVLSNFMCGNAALLNNTWGLTMLLVDAQFSFADLKYFQVCSISLSNFLLVWVETWSFGRRCCFVFGTARTLERRSFFVAILLGHLVA